MNRNFKQGIVQQFNLNVEHQLPANAVLTVGYAGSRGAHILESQVNENIGSPYACDPVIPGGTGPNPIYDPSYTLGCGRNLIIPSNGFQLVNSNNSVGAARYDSLQVKLETKTARHGLYALLGYTWARNFDSGMTDGLGTNAGAIYWPLPGTQKLDWGLSQLNLNNTFTASVLYDLPFGKGKRYGSNWSGAANALLGHWQVNLIERAESGFPLFLVDSANTGPTFGAKPGAGNTGQYLNYNFFSLNRPVQVANPYQAGTVAANPNTRCGYFPEQIDPATLKPGIAPHAVHTLAARFNPCAYTHATPGELSFESRAPLYGPRFVNTDFSIIKDFPLSLRENMNLQFRAEFFNLFNHPQFFMSGLGYYGLQDVNTLPTFGAVNQQLNNPRLMQFALRLNF